VVSDSTLLTSMSITCKYGNLFFLCFYGWLVTVLCRYGKFIFPYLYVWQVLLSEVIKDVETSYLVWEFIFSECSIGIYFSSTLCGEGCGNIQYVWELMFPICSIGIYFSSALGEGCWNIQCMGTYVSCL